MPDTTDTPQVVTVEREGDAPPVVSNIPWYKVVLVRGLRAGVTAFIGFQGFSAVGGSDLPHGSTIVLALKVAGFAAAWAMIQNSGEILLSIDKNYPGFRA